jgi:hypothetical protein
VCVVDLVQCWYDERAVCPPILYTKVNAMFQVLVVQLSQIITIRPNVYHHVYVTEVERCILTWSTCIFQECSLLCKSVYEVNEHADVTMHRYIFFIFS